MHQPPEKYLTYSRIVPPKEPIGIIRICQKCGKHEPTTDAAAPTPLYLLPTPDGAAPIGFLDDIEKPPVPCKVCGNTEFEYKPVYQG